MLPHSNVKQLRREVQSAAPAPGTPVRQKQTHATNTLYMNNLHHIISLSSGSMTVFFPLAYCAARHYLPAWMTQAKEIKTCKIGRIV